MTNTFNTYSLKISFLAGLLVFATAATAEPNTVSAVLQPPADRKPAPAFRLKNAGGKIIQLSDYRGKVVLLNFWATECGGCRIEIPWFMEFDKNYGKLGVAVVGISEDILYEELKGPAEAWARVTPFVSSQKLNYDILMGDTLTDKAYHIEALPATYVLDRQGRIAATYVGLVNRDNLGGNLKALLAR